MKGFIVGKFIPLHKGHDFLIRTALDQCDELFILSYTSDNRGYDEDQRFEALTTLYPSAQVTVLSSREVPDDEASYLEHRQFCCSQMVRHLFIPDVIFTSETYGDGFAKFASQLFKKEVRHVCVDQPRINFPISATAIRKNPEENKKWML